MSAGHWTALNLSRIECLKLCIVHPTGTYCLSHLFKAALVELAAVVDDLLYLGKAKSDALSASNKCCQTNLNTRKKHIKSIIMWHRN